MITKGGETKVQPRWKRVKGIALIMIMVVALGVIGFGMHEQTKGKTVIEVSFMQPQSGEVTIPHNKLKEDLEYLKESLEEVHPMAAKGLPEATIQMFNKYQDIEEMPIEKFVNIANEILTTLGDSHTSITSNRDSRGLPIQSAMVDGELYVIKSKDLCPGDQIIRVGGTSVEELLEKMKTYRAAENEYWLQVQFEEIWIERQFLEYCGIETERGAVIVEAMRSGKIVTETMRFTPFAYTYKPVKKNADKPIVSYEIDKSKNLCTLTLTKCEFSDEYIKVIREMFDEIKKEEVQHLAIDVRGNTGGNSLVANEIIKYLPINIYKQGGGIRRLSLAAKEQRGFWLGRGRLGSERVQRIKNNKYEGYNYAGDIYVLVDQYTFSSAMMLATMLKDNNLATIIGEPTGGKPHSYGDVLQFQLPNSLIRYTISYTEWFRGNEDKNEEDSLYPDYRVEYSLEDILSKEDKAKEMLYKLID